MNHILLAFALSGSLLSLPKIYGKSEADYDDLATNTVCKQAEPISEETNCEEGYSNAISFDFGNEVICEENAMTSAFSHPFDTFPSITCIGDIRGRFYSANDGTPMASFVFPEYGEGESIVTFALGDSTICRSIYSVPFGEGKWAVSLLSMGSARYLAGDMPNQALFDGGVSEQNGQSPQGEKEGPMRIVIGNGSVSGYVKWKYPSSSSLYPLAGAKVKLTFLNSWGHVDGYTNSFGYFSLSFNDMWAAFFEFEVTLHIYWESDLVKVVRNNDSVYEYAAVVPMHNGDQYVYPSPITFQIGSGDDYGEASSIYSAANVYAERAKCLNGGQGFAQCNFRYPETSGFDYSSDTHTVRVNSSEDSSSSLLSYEAWDVIGHEYGHHLQTVFNFSANIGGNHSPGNSDIEVKYRGATEPDAATAKDEGARLAWNESWPTFFETVAQKSVPPVFSTITFYKPGESTPRTLGDNYYTSRNFVLDDSLDNNSTRKGEACEKTIMCFLFKLYESGNAASYDSISISEEDLWAIVTSSKPKKFCEFVSAVAATLSADELSEFGKLLAGFQLSPSSISISSTQSSFVGLPTFSWTANGYGFSTSSFGYKHFENTTFTLSCYNSTKSLIFAEENITTTSYTLTQSQWCNVLASTGSNYFIAVNGYSSLGGLTGPYYSQLFSFTKPSSLQNTPNLTTISAKRYFEQLVGIPAGAKWRMGISFPYSGKKALQTFGTNDTMLWLYQADGTTLIASNDNSGYGTNAFICLEAVANTQYVLEVGFYSSSTSGTTKVSITPFVGCLANGETSYSTYNSFVNINTYPSFTWGSYLFGNSSKIITWSPPEDGNYTVSLESEFDNYLYVIDPTSSLALRDNVDYNDDSNSTTNASITNDYSASKKYFIVYSQYNNGNDLGDENSISVKFIKN